jgi:hypothetical protein
VEQEDWEFSSSVRGSPLLARGDRGGLLSTAIGAKSCEGKTREMALLAVQEGYHSPAGKSVRRVLNWRRFRPAGGSRGSKDFGNENLEIRNSAILIHRSCASRAAKVKLEVKG